ncbi:breast cancer anti-estrogen resistance protein 3 homolog isoform X3 [Bradysia coprophila]|uniref:breast cancer anti-estrogen resistance protein 3 homolog isoform X3 n=1 Tax=Bradysia coprophila TaxID=38358 RepID=UPI00187D9BCB|nr:breast cancer anti-estrogen resistance protein 3 homolog isoform X3 [Bradysia coprophila]
MGKSSSKLGKRRSQSVAWSFRFATLNKQKMAPIMVAPPHHLDIKAWLVVLDLQQYEESFSKFLGVEELMFYDEADIKQLGIRNSAHRARIVSSLVALRDKHQRGGTGTNKSSKSQLSQRRNQRYSLAVVPEQRKDEQPIYERLNTSNSKTKQSKSLDDLCDMDTPTENGQEVLALKKALEWELSLDSRDLRSHAWYHGPIPRQRAEEIVLKEGDFLIRDCVSQPGNYVLTCKSKGPILHFVINKILIQPETVYERVQFQFEDDAYDTVPDLITFYVGSGKAISAASGARIQFPCNRTYPLSFYATKYGSQNQFTNQRSAASPLHSPSLSTSGFSPMSSPPRTKRETPPRLPSKKHRSQSLTPNQGQGSIRGSGQDKYCSADGVIQGNGTDNNHPAQIRTAETRRLASSSEKCNSADGVIETKAHSNIMTRSAEEKSASGDGVIQTPNNKLMSRSIGDAALNNKFSTHSLPRTQGSLQSVHRLLTLSRPSSLSRDDSTLSPCIERKQIDGGDEENESPPSPPPKPQRNPSILRNENHKELPIENGPLNRVASYHASGSDSGNGSGDSAHSSAAGDALDVSQHRGVVIKNPRFIPNSASSATLKSFAEFDCQAAEEALMGMNVANIETISQFDLENFHTLLLPAIENKPLDNGALNTFRMLLSEAGPRVLANHLTRVDIKLILGDLENKMNSLDSTGIELIGLSHGEAFRIDLIERTECIRLLVAVTILTCQSDDERAETLNKWIQVAIDTKTALGNLFGFCAIMLGLCMPQIQKLEPTWHTLRQKYTDSAFNFEAKLRPTLKNMNDCSNPQAPNTTVPHLLPYVLLRDRKIEDILGLTQPTSTLITSCLTPWETSAADFGLTIMFAHLDSIRNFHKNLSLYQRNAQTIMSDSSSRLDELLEDAFRTEFHMKFLWGSKGALANAVDRHAKLEQVLTLMAEKFCHSDHIGTAA